MANFFEFTKVTAPDISASASFMRNAQDSISKAAEAFTAGADLVRNANIEKDTRIRNDNTAHWVNRINSAQSLAEVDSLRKELSSDEFKNTYENDLYIDTSQLVKALDTRPSAIETRTRIAEGLRSNEQGDVVSAAMLAIETASSDGELDALIQDLQVKNLTVGNSKTVSDAIATKRANLQNKKVNNLRFRELQNNLNNQQKREQYNKELITTTTSAMQKLLNNIPTEDDPTGGTTVADLEREVDSITATLVNKYGFDPVTVEASVRNLLVNGYQERQAAGINGAVSKLSADLQSKYFALDGSLKTKTGEEAYAKQSASIAKELYPTAIGQISSNPATLKDTQTVLKSLQDNGVDTDAFGDLPSELKTEETLGVLSSITDTGEFKRAINTLKIQYGLLQEYNTTMLQNQTRYTNDFNIKKTSISDKLASNLKAQARVNEKIAQAAGSDTSKLKDELAALHKDFEKLTTETETFLASPPNAAKDWAKSDTGVQQTLKVIKKSIKQNNSVENREAALAQLMMTYSIKPEDLINADTMASTSAPKDVADLMLSLAKEITELKKIKPNDTLSNPVDAAYSEGLQRFSPYGNMAN